MNIQSAIDRHGTTKAELARKLGSSPSYITQLVNCKSAPSMKQLDKLAELIGCKRWEFFIDEMDPAEVARILGLTAQPAPQPAAESASAEQQQAVSGEGGASGLPFGSSEPSAIGQQQPSVPASLICPHCGTPFVVEVKEK